MSYLDILLDSSPVVVLALDEASGATAADSSGNGNDGTITGSPTYGETGPVGGHTAIKFTDAGHYISTAATFAYPNGNLSVECWFKGTTKPGSGGAIVASLGSSVNPATYTGTLSIDTDGCANFQVADDGVTPLLVGTTDLTDGSWHHICGTAKTNGAVKLYVDGEVEDEDTLGHIWGGSALAFWVAAGGGHDGGNPHLGEINGTAAWAALYDRALTPLRITAHYTNTPPPAPPTPPDMDNPTIAGTPSVGHVLRCQPGYWWTDGGATISYQWRRDASNIGGATSATYTLQPADDGHSIYCRVTATGTPTETADSDAVTCGDTATVLWYPTSWQIWEPDTILLFDPNQEATFWTDAREGWVDSAGYSVDLATCNPWRVGSSFPIVDGKYRQGISFPDTFATDEKSVWLPGIILPTGQFTVEFWAKCSTSWVTAGESDLLWFGDRNNDLELRFMSTSAGKPRLYMRTPYATTQHEDVAISAADVWVHLAASYDGTDLVFYIDGSDVASFTGVTFPPLWTGSEKESGGVAIGFLNLDSTWRISDLRVSRAARRPDEYSTVASASTVTFSDTADVAVSRYVRGGTGSFGHDWSANVTDAATRAAFDTLGVTIGTGGKLEQSTPIKAGAPDSDYPTLGLSGDYSYNMGPTDHWAEFMLAHNLDVVLGFGPCPELLGGSVPPRTIEECSDPDIISGDNMGWAPEVPSDMAEYAKIVGDLYHYITTTYPALSIPYVSYMNEPDGGGFWDGTPTQAYDFYAAVVDAIRTINPAQKVGGLQFADIWNNAAYLEDFIAYCGTNDVPLDFVSWHLYSGHISFAWAAKKRIADMAADAGIPEPEHIVGELGWSNYHLPNQTPNGWPYGGDNNWWVNDYGASFFAASWLTHMRLGIDVSMYFSLYPSTVDDTTVYAAGTLVASDTGVPQAQGNVLRMLSLMFG